MTYQPAKGENPNCKKCGTNQWLREALHIEGEVSDQHVTRHSNRCLLKHTYSQQEKSEYTHHTDEAGSIIAVEEERVEAAEKRTKGPSSVEISNSCQWQVDRAEEQV